MARLAPSGHGPGGTPPALGGGVAGVSVPPIPPPPPPPPPAAPPPARGPGPRCALGRLHRRCVCCPPPVALRARGGARQGVSRRRPAPARHDVLRAGLRPW